MHHPLGDPLLALYAASRPAVNAPYSGGIEPDFDVSCRFGGKATIAQIRHFTNEPKMPTQFAAFYSGCAEVKVKGEPLKIDGELVFKGSADFVNAGKVTSRTTLTQHVGGNVNLSGPADDGIDVDVEQSYVGAELMEDLDVATSTVFGSLFVTGEPKAHEYDGGVQVTVGP
jgi:hypothetical protein